MISDIVCHIQELLEGTGYYSKVLFAELLTKDEQTFPVVYLKNGNYDAINIDKYNGVAWFRIGDVSIDEADDLQDVSCNNVVQATYPIIIAGAMPRKKDGATYIHQVVEDHFKLIGRQKDLAREIGAIGADFQLSGYTTNLETEFDGIDLNYKFSYFTLNVNLIVTIQQDCLIPCPE